MNVAHLAGMVAFVALWFATALAWDEQHDEALTCNIAVEELELPGSWRDQLPVAELYGSLDGRPRRTLGAMFDKLVQSAQIHPPLHYLIVTPWSWVAGNGPVALRLPGLAFGLLTLVGTARLAERWLGRRGAGTWALWLCVLSPWFAMITVFLRPYSLCLCLAVWSTLCALEAARGSRRAWIGFALLSLAGLYVHYYFAFVIAWNGAFLLLGAPRSALVARTRALAASLGFVTLCFLPWLPVLLSRATYEESYHYTAGRYDLAELARVHLTASRFLVDEAEPFVPIAWVLLAVTSAAAIFGRARTERPTDRVARTAAWTIPLVPAAILAADLVTGNRTLLISKYGFVLFLPLVVAPIAAAARLRTGRGARALLAAWILLFSAASAWTLHARWTRPEAFRALAEQIALEDEASHLVLLPRTRVGESLSFLRSLRNAGVQRVTVAIGSPADVDELVALARPGRGVRRITYAHVVVWRPSDPPPKTSLGIVALMDAAPESGWQVRRHHAETPPGRALGPGWLTVAGPARASFYGR